MPAVLRAPFPCPQASAGNTLNIVEKITGHIVPFSQSIFSAFNCRADAAHPRRHAFRVDAGASERRGTCRFFVPPAEIRRGPAAGWNDGQGFCSPRRIERSALGSLFLAAAGIAYMAVGVVSTASSPSTSIW